MKNLTIAWLSGCLMALSAAPWGLWSLSWIALAPLWLLLNLVKTNRLWLAVAWGVGYHGLALSWITGIHPLTWMGVPWLPSLLIALGCWLAITSWGTLLVVLWTLAMNFAYHHHRKSMTRVIIGVAAWCGLEYLWSLSPLWWTSLSFTQSPSNLIILQLARLSGPSAITAVIVAVNGLIAETIYQHLNHNKSRYLLGIALVLILSCHGIGWYLYQTPLADKPSQGLSIGLIQGNIPNQIKLFSQGWEQAIAGYTKGYHQLAAEGADIILTPETALPFFGRNPGNDPSQLYQAIQTEGVPIWVGTFILNQGGRYTNSLLTISGDGAVYSRYDKVKLVPLGEYIPLEKWLGKFIDRLSPLETQLQPGKPQQSFNTPLGKAVVGICYDSAFAEHFRYQTSQGGEYLITASNNAHYSSSMPSQHHSQDVMRAIENDRWLARATNTGYSAIVDPRGRTLWRSPLNQYQTHLGVIYRRQTITPYVKWGDWLTKLLLGVLVFVSLKNL